MPERKPSVGHYDFASFTSRPLVRYFEAAGSRRWLAEQLGQLGDGGRDCSRFIFSHEMARVSNLRAK
jgi:hypothetical protein